MTDMLLYGSSRFCQFSSLFLSALCVGWRSPPSRGLRLSITSGYTTTTKFSGQSSMAEAAALSSEHCTNCCCKVWSALPNAVQVARRTGWSYAFDLYRRALSFKEKTQTNTLSFESPQCEVIWPILNIKHATVYETGVTAFPNMSIDCLPQVSVCSKTNLLRGGGAKFDDEEDSLSSLRNLSIISLSPSRFFFSAVRSREELLRVPAYSTKRTVVCATR